MSYREPDLSKIRTVPFAGRLNKVEPALLAHPPVGDRSFRAFLDSLPDVLAARDLRTTADAIVSGLAPGSAAKTLMTGVL